MVSGSKFLLLSLLILLLGCSSQPTPPKRVLQVAEPDDPHRSLLMKFATSRKLMVIYYEGDRELMADACGVLENYFRGSVEIEWVSDMALHPTDLTGKSILIVGDHRHHLLDMLQEKLPLTLSPKHFEFHGQVFDQPSDVLTMLYPNPVDPTMPLFLLTGNEAASLYPYISAPIARHHVTIFREHKVILEGAFEHDAVQNWRLGEHGWRTLMDQTKLATTTERYRVFNYRMAADQTAISKAMMDWDQQWARLEGFLDRKLTMPEPIELYLYQRFEDKLHIFASYDRPTRYGNPSIRHISPEYASLHHALQPGMDSAGPAHLITLLATQNLGAAKTPVLETGLACFFAPTWGGQGTPYWAARLTGAGWAPSLKSLFNHPQRLKALPLSYQPFAASLVGFLHERWGATQFAKRYATWKPDSAWCAEQEQAWQTYLADQVSIAIKSRPYPKMRIPNLPAFSKGANHTFEGFSVERGYLSTRSDASLMHLAEIGANSVALVPYVRAKRHEPQPLLPLLGINKENDASIIHAGLHAKSLGMAVLLKPQLEGPWPGHIAMKSEADWQAFFDHYKRFMRHYAVMAEMYGFSALCVGVELVEASRHEAFWRDLAGDLRGVFSGKLVYAANWGEEFERIGFWDAYDAIGLDCYYPLSKDLAPDDVTLKAGAAQIIKRIDDVAARYNKPVWLTEVGFASVEQPWVDPHQDHGKQVYDGEAQARCFRAFIDAMAHSKSIEGVWWWKWHSDGRAGKGDKSFSCQDKPAEQVLANWLAKR